jgi:hypothetical protein
MFDCCCCCVAGVDELVQLGDKFVTDIREGRHEQEGWNNSMYGEHTAVQQAQR